MSCTPGIPAGIHVGDIGTPLQYQARDENNNIINLAGYTFQLNLKAPNNQYVSVVPSLYTDGTDGIVQYVTQSGDLSIAGIWQGELIIFQGSAKWNSNIISFKVYPVL